MIKNSYIPLYIATAVIALALFIGFVFRQPYAFHGTVINPPLPLSDFSLKTGNGESFRLSDQKGNIVLLFFGYTNCPDVCPTTLGTFKQVYDKLGNDTRKVRFVMITADPERDKLDIVAAYAARFNPEFVGLGGNSADLEKVRNELGVFVEKQESNSAAGYLLSHTASVFVLDQNGNLLMTLPYGTSATDMANDVIQLIEQSQPG